jgi:hypothetical protein
MLYPKLAPGGYVISTIIIPHCFPLRRSRRRLSTHSRGQ